MSCGEVHSQARALVEQGYAATVVAATLAISRSSWYYRNKPRVARIGGGMNQLQLSRCHFFQLGQPALRRKLTATSDDETQRGATF